MACFDKPVKLDNPRAWRTYLGGSLLSALHDETGEDGHFPEEWIMSVVAARNAGREDIVGEGLSHLAGTGESLKEWILADAQAILGGEHVKQHGSQPGVLVKLIDSAERLTVQVHPDRPTAQALFDSPYGKTECWHILGGRTVNGEAPSIYLGFVPGITREKWRMLFEAQDIPRMLACLHRFEVKPGDTVLIEGGVPHAIGAGCFLAEIQEPTDYTIRVERTTPSGFPVADVMCHQNLGFERMFDCFHYDGLSRDQVKDRWFLSPTQQQGKAGNQVHTLVGYEHTGMFAMRNIQVQHELELTCPLQFSALYVLSGEGQMVCAGSSQPIRKAEQYFLPAGVKHVHLTATPGQPLRILQCFGPKCSDVVL
ncbi:MAG: class I mannose-6-phosphate isomerase [Candidatus Limiplasma sp.]|nr:class I mannose-6-phosphate isomerase [Candidatus Limiplasma sp.]